MSRIIKKKTAFFEIDAVNFNLSVAEVMLLGEVVLSDGQLR